MTKATEMGADYTPQETTQTMNPILEAPEWVAEMHEYFRQYGYYRASDVERGLGDLTSSVGHALTIEAPINVTLG